LEISPLEGQQAMALRAQGMQIAGSKVRSRMKTAGYVKLLEGSWEVRVMSAFLALTVRATRVPMTRHLQQGGLVD